MAAAIAAAAAAGSPARADDEAMNRIVLSGRIVIGANDTAWPLSYLGPDGEHIGYHVDICQRIVAEFRRKLNLPQMKVVAVPVTMTTRTAMLANSTIDMDCGPNPITNASLRQSLTSHATVVDETSFMTTADKPRYTLPDLEQKTIGMVAGGSSAALLRAAARKQSFKVNEVFGRTGEDTFAMLTDGRVDAISGPTPLLMANRARLDDPSRFVLLDIKLGRVYSGIRFGLGDETLRAIANDVIVSLARTGELARLYDKWYDKGTLPGFPRPIGLAPSPGQAAIFAEPGAEMQGM